MKIASDKSGIKAILLEAAGSLEAAEKYAYVVFRALIALYAKQTEDEQCSENTHHSNAMGFNANDAAYCSSVAKSALSYQAFCKAKGLAFTGLTPKQSKAIAKKIAKYSGQLAKIAEAKKGGVAA